MSLKLASNNTPAYSYYSSGTGATPISVAGTVDGSGGTANTNTLTMYLIATTYRYSGISITTINEQAGIDWKLSLDNSTFTDSITPGDMNALSSDQVTTVYARAVLTNTSGGKPATGLYTTPDVQISYTENPS